jgi:hypothetical protein
VINPLSFLGPVANLAGTWLEGHVATKKAKTEAKIVTIKSEAKIQCFYRRVETIHWLDVRRCHGL